MSSRALRRAQKESLIEDSLNEEETEIIEIKPRKNNLFQQVNFV